MNLLNGYNFARRKGDNSYKKVLKRMVIESNWEYAKDLSLVLSSLIARKHVIFLIAKSSFETQDEHKINLEV
jgi:hypothetical protein